MASRILKAQMRNIQSWQDDDQFIEFSPDIMNVISARSETGKSVVYKVFYQMVFPNYYKFHGVNDLIRKGETSAEAKYWLENGSIITFKLYHNTQDFTIQYADGTEQDYMGMGMPIEIVREFGLIVDYDLKFILNIFTKDNPYPFVNTSLGWNADLLNQVFVNKDVDTSIYQLTDDNKVLLDKIRTANISLQVRQKADDQTSYIDTEKLEVVQKVLEESGNLYDVYDELRIALGKFVEASQDVEKYQFETFHVVDINDIRNLYLHLGKMGTEVESLVRNVNYLESIPDISGDTESIMQIRQLYEALSTVGSELTEINRLTAQLDVINESYTEISKEKEALDACRSIIEGINAYREELAGIHKELSTTVQAMVAFFNYAGALDTNQKELAALKAEQKVCPTCGKPF